MIENELDLTSFAMWPFPLIHSNYSKSPTVDGKVERNPDGKEVRFPVILSYREKEIARRIVLVFRYVLASTCFHVSQLAEECVPNAISYLRIYREKAVCLRV